MLRCPHCSATFQLIEVLGSCTESPPFALPVDEVPPESQPPEEHPQDEVIAAVAEQFSHSPESPGEAPAHELYAEAAHDGTAAIGTASDDKVDQLSTGELEAGIAAAHDGIGEPPVISEQEGEATDDASSAGTPMLESAPHEPITDVAATGETEETAPAVEPDLWAAMSESEAAHPLSVRTRPREPQIGVFGQLIGVVVGGVLGITLGYIILIWLTGGEGDFLDLRYKFPNLFYYLPGSGEP